MHALGLRALLPGSDRRTKSTSHAAPSTAGPLEHRPLGEDGEDGEEEEGGGGDDEGEEELRAEAGDVVLDAGDADDEGDAEDKDEDCD